MNDRVFTISKSYLHHEMDRGAKLARVKRIRIHGLRHSHISLLINFGFSALAIGERVGHEAVDMLKEENRSLKDKLEKAYEFMKQFMIGGINLLEKFLEWIGEKVNDVKKEKR